MKVAPVRPVRCDSNKENMEAASDIQVTSSSKRASRAILGSSSSKQSSDTALGDIVAAQETKPMEPAGQNGDKCLNEDHRLRCSRGAKTGSEEEDQSVEDDEEYQPVDDAYVKEERKLQAARQDYVGTQPQVANSLHTADTLEKLLQASQVFTSFLAQDLQKDSMEAIMREAEESATCPSSSPAQKQQPHNKKRKRGDHSSNNKTACKLYNGTLKEHQVKGVQWLLLLYSNGLNGILADQMGLGKTIQTLVFLAYIYALGSKGPYLVLGPLSTLPNWLNELQQWVPQLKGILYHGPKKEREHLFKQIQRNKREAGNLVIITSYEVLMADARFMKNVAWTYLVVDEGHRLKNMNCKLLQCLKLLSVGNKLLLTGTPLQNNLQELWTLLHFVQPDTFATQEMMMATLELTDLRNEGWQQILVDQERKGRVISKLHEILRPLLLRRIKDDVDLALPAKQEMILYASMAKEQQKVQKGILDKSILAELASQGAGVPKPAHIGTLNNILMQLRKTCNHPDLVTGPFTGDMLYPEWPVLERQSGKLALLNRLLKKLLPSGHKVIIFSQMTKMLDILDTFLAQQQVEALRIDGSVAMEDRQASIQAFKDEPNKQVFLLSTRAGGLGINLTSADTVIIYDSDWNPHQDMQAQDRCHRIGQTKPVLVLRLCTANSVETKMLERAQSKLALERVVIKRGLYGGDFQDTKSKLLSPEELLSLLQSAVQLQADATQQLSDKDLDMLLDRRHLAHKRQLPYPVRGKCYEVVGMSAYAPRENTENENNNK